MMQAIALELLISLVVDPNFHLEIVLNADTLPEHQKRDCRSTGPRPVTEEAPVITRHDAPIVLRRATPGITVGLKEGVLRVRVRRVGQGRISLRFSPVVTMRFLVYKNQWLSR